MARPSAVRLALLVALVVAASAQFGGGNRPPPPKPPASKADLPLIRCQVCEAVVKQAREVVKTLRAEVKPGKKLSEGDILEKLEKLCDPDTDEGEWVGRFDLVEDGDRLVLKDMGKLGECGTECRTVARACAQVLEGADLTEVSELLYAGRKRADLSQALCYSGSGACAKKAPAMPKDRPAGPKFKALTDEAAQHAKLMRSLKASGLSGQMYDRASLQDEMTQMQDEFEDDDEMSALLKQTQAAAAEGGDKPEGLMGDVKQAASKVVDSVVETAGSVASSVGDAVKSTFSKLTGKKGGGNDDDEDGEL